MHPEDIAGRKIIKHVHFIIFVFVGADSCADLNY